MTYQEAIRYLDSFINYEKVTDYSYNASFNLERMGHLLELLDNPYEKFKSIHIAGTKGKGSCAAMVTSILREAGFRVGLYTSPHLVSPRERIRLLSSETKNQRMETGDQSLGLDGTISEEEVCQLTEDVREAVDKGRRWSDLGEVSFFEVYTLLAFCYFAKYGVDFAVLEVGMGGRLDATNVVKPLVSVITPISFDHTDKLGSTLESIAKEKAGIIKEGAPVVSAPQDEKAHSVIKRRTCEKRTKLYEVGEDFVLEIVRKDQKGTHFNLLGLLGEYRDLELPLLGHHQATNAATAIGAVELLSNCGVFVSDLEVRDGLRDVVWPGRLQIIGERPLLLLDGAQNRASARAIRKSIEEIFSYDDLILVLGVSSDKDIRGIAEELCPISEEVILTRARSPRAARPELIRDQIDGLCPKITLQKNANEAIGLARAKASNEDLILITGSLYLVGEALSSL